MRIRITLGACIFALFLVVLASQYVQGGFPFRKKPLQSTKSAAEVAVSIAEQDADADGLKDWEEALWKTDPHNPDTDNDGTLDGKEVNEGRDPTKKGPHDEITVKSEASGASSDGKNPLTDTNNLSDAFIQSYVALKQQGNGEISEKDRIGLVDTLSTKTAESADARIYTEKDIHTVPTNTDSLHAYGNALAPAIAENSSPDTGNEPSLVQNLMQTGSQTASQRLSRAAGQYRLIVSALYSLDVPTDLVATHLTLINSFSTVGANILATLTVQSDPLRALTALSSYESEAGSITQTWNQIGQFMSQNGVTFTQQEYGALLNASI